MAMKILRRILFIFLCIVVLILVTGLLLPADVHVERKLLINAPPENVFQQINTLRNWEKWSPWIRIDTSSQLQYSGPESGAGATYKWLSNNKNIGKGSLSIISSFPPDSILFLMDYGTDGNSKCKFILTKADQKTYLTWSIESKVGMNPMSRWFGLFSDRMIGPDLEKGLSNLEQLITDVKIVDGYEIIDYEMPSRVLITVRDTASAATVTLKLSKMYNKISLFLKSVNLPPTGSPIAIFHNYSNHNLEIEACIPVDSIIKVPEGINCLAKTPQKTVMVKYFGPYKSISVAYKAIETYINNNNIQVTGPGWEEYVTNPLLEPDTNKWQTNIYYLLN